MKAMEEWILTFVGDLENAGALWEDKPVVVDGNLKSGRTPKELPVFSGALVEFLSKSG
jgi:protease I